MSNNQDALYEGAAFGLIEHRTLIEVRGSDRLTFLHNLCTNDIKSLNPGDWCEAFFTNVQGKTLCHALVFCFDETVWISTDPQLAEQLLPHLDKYLIREDVELIDKTADIHTYLVTGPRSTECIEKVNDPKLIIKKQPYGYFVFTPKDLNIAELLANAGGEPIDAATIELARIEAAFPSSGRDLTIDNLPQEIGRDNLAISFTKGCYLGQETVARIDALGRVNKKLVSLQFAGSETPAAGTELMLDEKVVGKVTSACWSPKLDCPIALGFVRCQEIDNQAKLSSKFGDVLIMPHAETQKR